MCVCVCDLCVFADPLKAGQTFYVVSTKWWEAWARYLQLDSEVVRSHASHVVNMQHQTGKLSRFVSLGGAPALSRSPSTNSGDGTTRQRKNSADQKMKRILLERRQSKLHDIQAEKIKRSSTKATTDKYLLAKLKDDAQSGRNTPVGTPNAAPATPAVTGSGSAPSALSLAKMGTPNIGPKSASDDNVGNRSRSVSAAPSDAEGESSSDGVSRCIALCLLVY